MKSREKYTLNHKPIYYKAVDANRFGKSAHNGVKLIKSYVINTPKESYSANNVLLENENNKACAEKRDYGYCAKRCRMILTALTIMIVLTCFVIIKVVAHMHPEKCNDKTSEQAAIALSHASTPALALITPSRLIQQGAVNTELFRQPDSYVDMGEGVIFPDESMKRSVVFFSQSLYQVSLFLAYYFSPQLTAFRWFSCR